MRLKQTLFSILCMALAFSGTTFTASAADPVITAKASNSNTITVTAVNRAIGAADEMILFTRENSSKLTDSNIYSTAAVVDYHDGEYSVTSISERKGAVEIPANGFVLFGHGTSEDWIKDNLNPGDSVEIIGYKLPEPIIGGPQLIINNGSGIPIDLIDEDQQSNTLAVYTRHFGEMTKPFTEDTVQFIIANDAAVVKSTYALNGQRGTNIPANGYVISASGSAATALSDLNLEVGQTVQIINVTIPILPSKYVKVNGIAVGIDKINGPRGAGEVILYQPSYGATTNQNAWGMELTVSGNKVTRVVAIEADPNGGFLNNNSPIPADGYVLSIQSGSPYYDQLIGQVQIGAEVELVTDNLTYQAAKTSFDAFNPKVKEDNPNGWNDSSDKPYPGFRGTDQLIVYNRNYGNETGTNPWGSEVVVNDKGYVISNGGNNKKIPEGGYVLSGHGVKNTWLTNNAPIGAKVSFDFANKQVLVIFTPESYLDRAAISIESAEKSLQQSKEHFMDVPYDQIKQKIADAKAVYEQAKAQMHAGGTSGLLGLLNDLDVQVIDANYMNFESPKVQTRGVWLRPKEKSLDQVKANLQKIKETGINSIYLETWWDGYTTWPTSIPDTELNPIYEGFDVLGAYIEEGKKLGLEIHAWVENFFAGGPVVQNHPDWRLMSRKGDDYEVGSFNAKWYWLNPALPQTRDFVASVYKELVTKYDIDSLHLDYARYPGSGDYTNDFGYDTYTRKLFSDKYGVDPINLHPGAQHWDEWLQFRADIINDWVKQAAEDAHKIKPKLQITAAVWPNYDEAPKSHAQETKKWLDNNWIDQVFHMSYAPDSALVVEDLKNTMRIAGDNSFVSSGLDTFQGNTTSVVVDQVNEANKNGAAGAALFEFEGLFNYKYDKLLKIGVYRNEAIMPDYRTTKPLATIMEEIIRKINEIYIPFGGLSSVEADKLKQMLQVASQALKANPDLQDETASIVMQQIDIVKSELLGNSSINLEVKNRMNHDLDYGRTIAKIYFSKAASKAQLSKLTVSTGALTPAFHPSTYSYRVQVGYGVAKLNISASASKPNSVISVANKQYDNDSAIPVELAVGSNQVKIKVISDDGLTESYTVTIVRESNSGSVGGGGITPPTTTPVVPDPQDQENPSRNVKLDSDALTLKSEVKANGKTLLTALVKADELNKALKSLKGRDTITIDVGDGEDIQQVGIPAQSLIDARASVPNAAIIIQGNHAAFELPISLLNLSAYSNELGGDIKDAVIYITMEQVKGNELERIRNQIKQEGATLLDDRVIDFSVRVEANGKVITISNFGNMYVARSIILDQSAPSDIATAVYIDPITGRFSYAPSLFTTAKGQTTVQIKRNSTSMYAVIQSSKTFKDLTNHWAKSDIELLASKRVIEGISFDQFAPDQKVSRAEFVSLLVRALGLNIDSGISKFDDVSESAWFAGTVGAAVNAGIVNGYKDGSFGPKNAITREEMAVMVGRAIAFAGKSLETSAKLDALLAVYRDKDRMSSWSQSAIGKILETGIMKGVTSTTFEPGKQAMRSEAAVVIKRMLQYLAFLNS
ncbi:hypothetical protein Back11_10510 [Paenibacillus baekrokdamisoli]|uniref:Uncharacterized protein n=1 Tax=Paenibacillus baekrokdamisoli TaxID=1712516 RepID=A0A3G9IN28_9BACL|nr:S-layer homology domain-containing protein [Paenibacillus baekrokdamisoli]MBB3067101.1 uncharacterized lipoprotein YddW (UPF0748 family) [Paenibacillus baekrokdamisoli]BBH19706.1 hypothetical protein Back11_10510 [Paenibacillus baekrokdamisoli]